MFAFENDVGTPMPPVPEPIERFADLNLNPEDYKIPSLAEMGVDESKCGPNLYPGGESEGLKRFHKKFADESWICQFEKPKTTPNSLMPSTTVLSPYLKFGNLSIRLFYEKLMEIYRLRKNHTKPPESLEGQVMFREYFYFVGAYTDNFDKISGNAGCRQIKWDENEEVLMAWKEARTGFPFIDAIMTQLRQGMLGLEFEIYIILSYLKNYRRRMDSSFGSPCRGLFLDSRGSVSKLGEGTRGL